MLTFPKEPLIINNKTQSLLKKKNCLLRFKFLHEGGQGASSAFKTSGKVVRLIRC